MTVNIELPTRHFRKGDTLFVEGQPGREAFLIQEGYVSITRVENGATVSLATRSEGEIVGEMALIDDTVRSATVTAGSDVEALIITQADLEKALTQAPVMLATILRQLLESLRASNDLVAMYATRLAELTAKPS